MSQENKLFFDHQALIVNNLQKTGDFYIDILGLQEIPKNVYIKVTCLL